MKTRFILKVFILKKKYEYDRMTYCVTKNVDSRRLRKEERKPTNHSCFTICRQEVALQFWK